LLTEHQLLLFWVQLFVLLVSARGLGALARKLGQPQVIGELTAGLLLGPSVLGHLAPGVFQWLFPAEPVQRSLLAGVAWLGVLLLLVVTGFETDLTLVRRMGRATARVALGSLLIPVAGGLVIGFHMPDAFVGPAAAADRTVFALFMGTALGISALPVLAAVLTQLGLMRRSIAQAMIAAAMVDDLAGWTLLGVSARLAQSGNAGLGQVGITLTGMALFATFAFTLGQRGIDALLRRLRQQRSGPRGALTVAVAAALAAGGATQALGLEAVLGAFVAGIVLGRSKFQHDETFTLLDRLTGSFLAPIFFSTAGLRVDLSLLAESHVVSWGIGVLVAASATKFGGAYLGGWFAGLPRRERLALGAGLNARGAVEIVVATVGLSIGVLNGASYAIVVLMAMATSIAAPPLLRLALRGWRGTEEEQLRLERERMLSDNVLVRATRILLPSHGGPNSLLAARIVDLAWPKEVEVTLLSAGADVPPEDLARVRAVFADRPVVHEHVANRTTLGAILDHAVLGYGVMAVGATDVRVAGRLISPVIDELLGVSPLPVVMVRRGVRENLDAPPAYRRILVPATGTTPGRAAQEMAYQIAARTGAHVLIAHVVTHTPERRGIAFPAWEEDTRLEERAEVAMQVLGEARDFATRMGVHAETVIRHGVAPSDEILALAREREVDLLVVAANLRQLTGRPFLGHGAEDLLARCEATTVIVTAPPGWVR
jgi:Kef-type K+ transport system membrane component KefB/nucleotide-binding universal stress UspA family protein